MAYTSKKINSLDFWLFWIGVTGLAFILGKCSVPQPEPVVFTKVNTVEVIKFEASNLDRECMAQALYAEFRGSSRAAAIAGAEVIKNRVIDYRFPDTYCGVINHKTVNEGITTFHFSYQDKSDPNFYKTARVFSNMRVSPQELKARNRAYEIADKVMASKSTLPANALNYHTTAVNPDWSNKLQKHSQIGATIYYVGY